MSAIACAGGDGPAGPDIEGPGEAPPGSWSVAAPLPIALADGAAAVHEGRIYVAGGRPTETGEGSRRAYRYELSSNRWDRLADLPEGLVKPGMAVSGGRLLVIGGNLSTEHPTPQADVWAWDDELSSWTHHSRLPVPSFSPTAATTSVGVLVTRLGGLAPPPGDSTAFLSAGSMQWRFGPPAPVTHERLVSRGSEIWAIGTDAMALYDAGSGTWAGSELLPTNGFVVGAWSRDGKLHLVQRLGTTVDHLVRDGPSNWAVRAAPPQSARRSGAMTVTLDGRLFLIGGSDPQTGLLSRVDVYEEPGP